MDDVELMQMAHCLCDVKGDLQASAIVEHALSQEEVTIQRITQAAQVAVLEYQADLCARSGMCGCVLEGTEEVGRITQAAQVGVLEYQANHPQGVDVWTCVWSAAGNISVTTTSELMMRLLMEDPSHQRSSSS